MNKKDNVKTVQVASDFDNSTRSISRTVVAGKILNKKQGYMNGCSFQILKWRILKWCGKYITEIDITQKKYGKL